MKRKNRITLLDTDILKDAPSYDFYYRQMPKDRQEKIDRYRFEKDKRLSLGAGLLLQLALDQAGISLGRPDGFIEGVSAKDSRAKTVEFSCSKQGKPFIKNHEDLFFNLSHSGRLAACALSDRPVGIDIEGRHSFKESLIRRVFAPEEIELAQRMEQEEETSIARICTLLWTVKESVMKYFGKGLSMDPVGIRVVSAEKKNGSVWNWKVAGYEDLYIRSWSIKRPGISPLPPESRLPEIYQLSVCSEYGDFDAEPEWIAVHPTEEEGYEERYS